jgi:hypothetical protein
MQDNNDPAVLRNGAIVCTDSQIRGQLPARDGRSPGNKHKQIDKARTQDLEREVDIEIDLPTIQRTYVSGLYQIHHSWVQPLRDITHNLIIQLGNSGDRIHQERIKTAFFALPAIIKVMSMCKLQSPISFLRATAERVDDAVTLILRAAMGHVKIYQKVQERNKARYFLTPDHVSVSTKRKIARQTIQGYCAVGRYSAAARVLKASSKLFDDHEVHHMAHTAKLLVEQSREILRTLNPEVERDNCMDDTYASYCARGRPHFQCSPSFEWKRSMWEHRVDK